MLLCALQNPLLAAANASSNNADDDKLSDYIPDSRDLSMSRAVSSIQCACNRDTCHILAIRSKSCRLFGPGVDGCSEMT